MSLSLQSFEDPCPCFIVGMSRGGTTWLTKLLNSHTDCVALGETTFWSRGYIKPSSSDLRYTEREFIAAKRILAKTRLITAGDEIGSLKKLSQQAWEDLVDGILYKSQTPSELFSFAMETVCEIEGKSRWIEKTPHHLNSIDRIISGYPTAKFIVQVRDPYGFMSSYKFQGERKEEAAKKYFRRLYHPIACAMLWKRYYQRSIAAAGHYPDNVQLLNFNDLKSEPCRVYREVLEFLDLNVSPFPSEVQDKNSSFNSSVKRKLSNADIYWMNMLASAEIGESKSIKKYATCFSFDILISLLRLPVWFFWLLGPVRKKIQVPFFSYIWRWVMGR
ncbi:sulfotransferase [Akkermansiaceae bacterium]|nr:sulfotransferase [Akkermansiaceae bacterium]